MHANFFRYSSTLCPSLHLKAFYLSSLSLSLSFSIAPSSSTLSSAPGTPATPPSSPSSSPVPLINSVVFNLGGKLLMIQKEQTNSHKRNQLNEVRKYCVSIVLCKIGSCSGPWAEVVLQSTSLSSWISGSHLDSTHRPHLPPSEPHYIIFASVPTAAIIQYPSYREPASVGVALASMWCRGHQGVAATLSKRRGSPYVPLQKDHAHTTHHRLSSEWVLSNHT